VICAVLYCYLVGWSMMSIGLALAIRGLRDRDRRQVNLILVVVATGVVWPVVVLGAVQLVAVAVAAEVARGRNRRRWLRENGLEAIDYEFNEQFDETVRAAEADAHCRRGICVEATP
jgi:hypothetical protein